MSIPPKKVAHLGAFQFFDLDRLEENQNQRVASIIYTPLKINGEPGPLQLLGRFSHRSCMNLLGNSSFNSFCRAFPVCRSPHNHQQMLQVSHSNKWLPHQWGLGWRGVPRFSNRLRRQRRCPQQTRCQRSGENGVMSQLEGHKKDWKKIWVTSHELRGTSMFWFIWKYQLHGCWGLIWGTWLLINFSPHPMSYCMRLLQWTARETTTCKFHEKFFGRRCHTKC